MRVSVRVFGISRLFDMTLPISSRKILIEYIQGRYMFLKDALMVMHSRVELWVVGSVAPHENSG